MNLFKRTLSVFEVVAAVAVLIVLLRMLFPKLLFDTTSLILCVIAALALFFPRLLESLPPLTRTKHNDVEVEFDESIKRFEERVVEAEKAPAPHPQKPFTGYPAMRETYVNAYKDILSSQASNTEKILAAAILAEQMLTETAGELELLKPGQQRSPSAIVSAFASHGFINDAEQKAFQEFWSLRNRIVHGGTASPSDAQTARVLDLSWRLVRTLA